MSSSGNSNSHKLGWFLCWAVVFADIGTSLYYVPGILYGQVGNLAGLFVLMSSVVFILLVLKYIEITDRYPEGGGVVTVATKAFNPWFGALGGMFITVDYFLTASISAVSGFSYLNSIINLGGFIGIFAIIGLILLGILNIVGIKESAKFAAIVATIAVITDIVLVLSVATQIQPDGWNLILNSLTRVGSLGVVPILTGFAGSFLAFSGLESISQLSPAMQKPRKKIAGIAMLVVVVTIMITAPFLTLFSTNLLNAKVDGSSETVLDTVAKVDERTKELEVTTDPVQKAQLEEEITQGKEYSSRFISELGAQYGGPVLKIAVVLSAAALLLFAANTAIIGAYHVFIALARQKFLPKVFLKHNKKFGSPHFAVALAIIAPILIIIATKGDVDLLGELYAFGLLGAFGLSSLGVDVVRWKESHKINFTFVIGIITTVLVFVAWITNLFNKELATLFGGGITIIGMIIAYFVHKNATKNKVEEVAQLEVKDYKFFPKNQIFLPVFDEYDSNLFKYIAAESKLLNKEVLVLYIRNFNDIYQSVSNDPSNDPEAQKFMKRVVKLFEKENVNAKFDYITSTDIADTINSMRKRIKPAFTIITPHKQSGIMEFLRGDVMEKIIQV